MCCQCCARGRSTDHVRDAEARRAIPPPREPLNAVEGFFAKLSKRRLKRGVFHSVIDLQTAINRYLAEHNRQPKPFVWTADPDEIIAAVKRGHQALDLVR